MGLDLTLLPFYSEDMEIPFSHDVIQLSRNYELFDIINAVEKQFGRDVPENFTSYVSRDDKYEDIHYGITATTSYGDSLKYVKAKDLWKVMGFENLSWRNKAVIAYLRELPENLNIALYWH